MTFPHGGPPAPPAAGSGAETILGMFRAEDYGAHSTAAGSVDASGGINLAAFIAASTGGGLVLLDSGLTYQVRRPVVLPANVELVIPTGTVLQAGPGLVGDVVTATNVAGVRISGGGTIDANRAAGTTGNGVTLTGCTEAQLEEVSVINAYTDGVALVTCTRTVVDCFVGANGRHGIYHSGTTFGRGQITARDNGQRIAGSGVVFDAASTDHAYAPLVATDTRAGGSKTQQYGVLEVAASGSDRNTYAAFALGGNATGTSSLVGPASGPAAGNPTGPAGGDLTGAYPNPTVANGAVTGAKIAAAAGIVGTQLALAKSLVWNSAAIAVANGVWTTVSFNNVSGGALWAAGNPTRVTVTWTGYALIFAYGSFDASAAGTIRAVRLRRNGTAVMAPYEPYAGIGPVNNGSGTPMMVALVPCTAGDYFEYDALQDAGVSLNWNNCRFEILGVSA